MLVHYAKFKMAAMKSSLKLSYRPQYFRWRLDIFLPGNKPKIHAVFLTLHASELRIAHETLHQTEKNVSSIPQKTHKSMKRSTWRSGECCLTITSKNIIRASQLWYAVLKCVLLTNARFSIGIIAHISSADRAQRRTNRYRNHVS